MRYFKWADDVGRFITGIPGFVFTSLADAICYESEAEGWIYDMHGLRLYTFEGIRPTRFPIMLGSVLCHQPKRKEPQVLLPCDVDLYFKYFAALPADYFINGADGHGPLEGDVELFMNLAKTAKALKPPNYHTGYVYDIEVYYHDIVEMQMVSPDLFKPRRRARGCYERN